MASSPARDEPLAKMAKGVEGAVHGKLATRVVVKSTCTMVHPAISFHTTNFHATVGNRGFPVLRSICKEYDVVAQGWRTQRCTQPRFFHTAQPLHEVFCLADKG